MPTATKNRALAATAPIAAAAADITIAAEPKKAVIVDLVEQRYTIKPPKSAMAVKLAVRAKQAGDDDPGAVMAAISEWVNIAFGAKAAPGVMERLEDPDDDLDIIHVMNLIEALVEVGAPTPPT